MAKVAISPWVPQISRYQIEDSIRQNHGFVCFKQSSKTCRLSSSSTGVSSTAIRSNQEVPSCDTQICKFCELGSLKLAINLLFKSSKSNLELATYCSVLQLCADMKSLQDGKKVHSFIDLKGIQIEGVLGSKLVFMYVKCGDLMMGRRVFDKVANDKVFLWNLLINEYAKIGNFKQSLFLYGRMQELGVKANSHTFSCILKCFAAEGSVEKGKQVHGLLLRLGFGSYTTVVNSLIAFYFKFGKTRSAHKLFDELTDRDVITWNSMISGYTANGLSEKGIGVFQEMVSLGIAVDLATMVITLAACANLGVISLGRAVHGYALKASFKNETTFNNTLLDMYSKCGDIESAEQIFRTMDERSVVTWTSMISGFARVGLSHKAVAIFHEMRKEGIKPDKFAVTSILHACACSGNLENGKELHNFIVESNILPSLSVSNALMDMYSKCGSMEDAHDIFTQMPAKDIVSWNTMIGGFSKNGYPNEALNLFVAMQKELEPDSVTMTCVLPACGSLAALDRGREIHGYILRKNLPLDRYVCNALMDMYMKCGALVLAQKLFDRIPVKDLVSWTVMVAGYGMHGFGKEAVTTFNEMRQVGIQPDEVSFISILYACSHSGLLREGWMLFNFMRNECRIEPKLEHYACMVDLLARSGKLSKAYEFIEIMPIEPDATVWGALLCGCRIHHDVELAEKVAEKVFELEPDNTGYYVLLGNIYAEAEKWEEVRKLRERIGQRGLKKNPGCSWIEAKGKVQIFVAGGSSSSYPLAKNINLLLKEWRMEMKEEGFSPKLRYSLINADDFEKEAALCDHSEKLAMAFGILSLPPGKTVRVTKNLRICGDCHEMAKFVSKREKREIILRDSNRFHHFIDGICSCRGFW